MTDLTTRNAENILGSLSCFECVIINEVLARS
jgi:hypothetical protein